MIIKDLITLGFSQAEADLIDYIYLNPNCSVKDICRDTNFVQPEVCVLVNKLKEYLIEEKHTQSRGRPYISYNLEMYNVIKNREINFSIYKANFRDALVDLKSLDSKR